MFVLPVPGIHTFTNSRGVDASTKDLKDLSKRVSVIKQCAFYNEKNFIDGLTQT